MVGCDEEGYFQRKWNHRPNAAPTRADSQAEAILFELKAFGMPQQLEQTIRASMVLSYIAA